MMTGIKSRTPKANRLLQYTVFPNKHTYLSIFMIIGYIFDDIHRNIWLVELLILCSIIFILIIIRFIVNIINYRKYRKICVDYVL